MSDVCGRALSDKNLCSVKRFSADCKCLNHRGKTDGQQKMKRLKSRKERSQMRGGGKEVKSKSYHQYSRRQSSKDIMHLQNCCHSSCHCSSRRDVLFPNVVPAAQEPSIITDSRLIGHHGLFNHEVKSIDIERLLSKQRKLEKSGHQAQEKSNATLHPSSTSHVPSPLCTNDLLGANADEAMPYERKADLATKDYDESLETEKKVSQGSDVTPGQRPEQQLDLSSGSFKSTLSSKHRSLDVVVIKSGKTNAIISEKARESQLTPTIDREHVKTLNKKIKRHMVSTLEHTPKNQDSAGHQTQAHGLSQSPARLSSSHTADSFDMQQERQDPDCVSKSVSAVAAGLCDSLHFPHLRRRNLVAESRRVLLKALQERHGPRLKENLEVQRCLSFNTDPLKDIHDQGPTMRDEDELWPTDALTTLFQANTASQLCFDTQKTTSFKVMGSKHFNWKLSPQLRQNLEQTAEWLTSPVETSVSLLDDILRPTCSPQFCMDFEPSEVTANDRLFVPSPNSCWGEKASTSQHWEDSLNSPKSKEALMFGSFENNFMNHTRAVTERRRSVSRYSDSNTLPFFPYPAQLSDRHSAEQLDLPQNLFETKRNSVAPSFSAQIHNPPQSNHFQPLSQFSHPLTHPPFRPHPTDMMHYPPSHMLERDAAPPLSSFPSPEQWCFPPMRLY